jgi:hypothetical protein
MPGSRIYRISDLTLNQINWVLSQLSDRLDQIEGFRGEPIFYDDVNIKTKIFYKDSNGTTLHSIGE